METQKSPKNQPKSIEKLIKTKHFNIPYALRKRFAPKWSTDFHLNGAHTFTEISLHE